MRATSLLIACGTAALLLSASDRADAADAHHELLEQRPIKKGNQVVGFRAILAVHPEGYTETHPSLGGDVRLGLGQMKFSGQGDHREAAAGVSPGYIVHQLKMREITGPKASDRGALVETLDTKGQSREVEVEVLYKDNPHLVPGSKMDLVAGFWKGYWHIWGAKQGPVHDSDEFIVELPGTQSMGNLRTRISGLNTEIVTAKSAEEAAKPQVEKAAHAHGEASAAVEQGRPAHDAAYSTYQQESQAAQLVLKLATHEEQAAFQAVRSAYYQKTDQAYTVQSEALQTARAKYYAAQAKVGPAEQAAYQQERSAISTAYSQASNQAYSAWQAASAQPYTPAYQQALAVYHKATADALAIYSQAEAALNAKYMPHQLEYEKERAKAAADYQQTVAAVTQEYNAASTVYNQAMQGPQAIIQKANNTSQAKYQPARSAFYTLRYAEQAKADELAIAEAAVSAAQAQATEAGKQLSGVEAQVAERQFLRRLKKKGLYHQWKAEQKAKAAAAEAATP